MLRDVKLFFHEYWQWRYFKGNVQGYALGFGSVSSYLAVQIAARTIVDTPLQTALSGSPVLVIFIILGLAALLAYNIWKAVEQQRGTLEMCDHLDRLRWFRIYKDSLAFVQSIPVLQQGAWQWADFGISLVKSASDSLVERLVEHGIRKELASIAGVVAAEYAVRLALVLAALALTGLL